MVLGRGDAPPGAAEPLRPRRAGRARRRRHRRLGRRVAGHARPREPRAAVARARCAARRHRAAGKVLAPRLTVYPEYVRDPDAVARIPTCGSRCSARPTPKAWPATTTGPRAATCAPDRSSRSSPHTGAGGHAVGEVLTVCSRARRSASTRSSRCSKPRLRVPSGRRSGRPAPARDRGRRRHLRAEPQHQLHEHLHVQVPVLRVLEGPAVAQPPRRPVPARPRGDPAARDRSGRVRCHRGLPAGRHPPELRRRLLPRGGTGGERGRARDPHARLHRARGHRRRPPPRHAARATTSPRRRTPAWPRCPAPPPRSSTTRCAR